MIGLALPVSRITRLASSRSVIKDKLSPARINAHFEKGRKFLRKRLTDPKS